jgi:hypothetical protein
MKTMASVMSDITIRQPDHNELASIGWTANEFIPRLERGPLGMAITISVSRPSTQLRSSLSI